MARDDLQTPERYGGEPLYGNFPKDYEQTDRPFTVTVAGPERHSGGSPTTYVVEACSTEKAWARTLGWLMETYESPDCLVIEDASYEGLPAGTGRDRLRRVAARVHAAAQPRQPRRHGHRAGRPLRQGHPRPRR
ncbi:hypothetical protein E4K10_30330 [Streptomyces sp. T1317-0309]|nr:hypothetical protein E4K10_30330 [Streptomyces sp. T1317-0309]